ncbi:hypothetical protein SCP_1602920 [Sparassis crispa]|uniref:F-box domain-containing protein n=1 Tax=Sparassis crispa TaxID=139825 RepID=A0A401H5G5_9APHY|nr:hypothetical protein SCP_1602920 [Sparassis crispa]GBE89629.1 hypothetical protein SCP_1602920 [Sparassis crispa]
MSKSHVLAVTPPLCQELYDMIIDAVAANKSVADLAACKSAGRVFVHSARKYLHGGIRLRAHTDLQALDTLFTPDRLLTYVRQVAFCGCQTKDFSDRHDCPLFSSAMYRPDYTWIIHVLPYLHRFKGIRCLELCDLSWGDIPREAREFILSNFPSVIHLSLRAVDFWTSRELIRTLQAFPNLSILYTCAISCYRPNHTTSQVTSTAPLKIDQLVLHGVRNMRYIPLIYWVLGHRTSVDIAHVGILWDDLNFVYLVELMRKLAPSLVTLHLEKRGFLPDWYLLSRQQARVGPDAFSQSIVELRRRQATPIDVDESHQGVMQTLTFVPPDAGVERALSLLAERPILGSGLSRLAATLFWNSFTEAAFILKLLSQIVGDQTSWVYLHIYVRPSWHSMPWSSVDDCVAEIGENVSHAEGKKFTLVVERLQPFESQPWDADIIRSCFEKTSKLVTDINIVTNTSRFTPTANPSQKRKLQ